MRKNKVGIGAGAILVLIITKIFRASPSEITIGPIKFDIPTSIPDVDSIALTKTVIDPFVGHWKAYDNDGSELTLAVRKK